MSSRGRSPSTDRSSQSPAPTAKPLSERTKGNELCLFFSDNTLSEGRGRATPDMIMHLDTLRETCAIGVVSASDIETLSRQFGGDGNDGGKEVLGKFDYVFADNGVTAYKDGKTLPESTSFRKYVGQPNYNKLVNKILELVMNIPIDKTGTFLELRGDMMHITPVGRSADQDERKAFQRQDNRRKIRGKLIAELREFIKKDDELNTKRLTVTMSGLISVNIVPEDWNKAHCLKTLEKGTWKTVHIIGDKTRPGGDGTAISTTLNFEEYTVTDPDDTMDLLGEAFGVSF